MLSKDEVRYIAHLSRVNLEDHEAERLTKDLEHILQYIEKLKELDVTDVKPTSHVLPLQNVYREDNVRPSLSQEEVMKISIVNHKGSFKVPQVIE